MNGKPLIYLKTKKEVSKSEEMKEKSKVDRLKNFLHGAAHITHIQKPNY